MSDREPDFFHKGEEWSAVVVPGSGTMMLLPETPESGTGRGATDVACPWCGFYTTHSMVCDRCGSPLPDGQSSFWSLVDSAT